jgi:hypothetical protein
MPRASVPTGVPVDLPLGEELDWKPIPRPRSVSLRGSHILARPVNAESDAVPLFSASHLPDGDPAIWTYLPDGPYESSDHLRQTLIWAETSEDPAAPYAMPPLLHEDRRERHSGLRPTPRLCRHCVEAGRSQPVAGGFLEPGVGGDIGTATQAARNASTCPGPFSGRFQPACLTSTAGR